MDIQEIRRYIEVGSGYIEVDRSYPEKYQGLCRRIYIRENEIQIDFCTAGDIELNEGESTFYFGYENFKDVIKSAEEFLKTPVSEWTNYNRTWNEWYFPIADTDAYKKLLKDLKSRKLEFPKNFSYMRICDTYALGVFAGKINPDDNMWNIVKNTDFTKYLCSLENEFTKY